ncbi:hypothetical protein [Afifella pfennigii]|nr:hypothetical protein [Afifella pfennigii]
MSAFSRFVARLHRRQAVNPVTARARSRFARSMPGETGALEALRLHGLVR